MISRVTTAGEPEEGLFKRAGCQVSSLADWATERKLPRPFEVFRDWQGTQTFCEAIPGPRQQNGTISLAERAPSCEGVIGGHPLLVESALRAFKNWRDEAANKEINRDN